MAVVLDGIGVIVGRKTGRLNGAADLQTGNLHLAANVAVDEYSCNLAALVLHIDGLRQAAGLGDLRHSALDRCKQAFLGSTGVVSPSFSAETT